MTVGERATLANALTALIDAVHDTVDVVRTQLLPAVADVRAALGPLAASLRRRKPLRGVS